MAGEVVVENSIDLQGVRTVHLMAPQPMSTGLAEQLSGGQEPSAVDVWEDAVHLHHLKVSWRSRGFVELVTRHGPHEGRWRVMLYELVKGKRVRDALAVATEAYALECGVDPDYAFIRRIPKGADDGVEIGRVFLFEADWVPEGFIALARGDEQKVRAFERLKADGETDKRIEADLNRTEA